MTEPKFHQRRQSVRPLLLSIGIAASFAGISLSGPAHAAEITVYKSPWCGCCSSWVDYLQAKGHIVTTNAIEDLGPIKKLAGVPEPLEACHTAAVEGYVIEGHVPATDIERLLAERPDGIGLAVAGMPVGAPGMEGGTPDSYDVILFRTDGSTSIYAQY